METLYDKIINAQNEITALKTSHQYGLGTFKIWTAYRDTLGGTSGFLNARYLVYEQVEDGGDSIPAIAAEGDHLNIQIDLSLSYSEGKLQIYIFFYKRDYYLPTPPETVRIWVRSTAELRFVREGRVDG